MPMLEGPVSSVHSGALVILSPLPLFTKLPTRLVFSETQLDSGNVTGIPRRLAARSRTLQRKEGDVVLLLPSLPSCEGVKLL
jgi:hypothetical protein